MIRTLSLQMRHYLTVVHNKNQEYSSSSPENLTPSAMLCNAIRNNVAVNRVAAAPFFNDYDGH